ncbi:MAG: hypothetical protein LH613_02755, partial [Chamaesiphon sp.]|nr:hypothetical protein [Chamaesiphon sp.]
PTMQPTQAGETPRTLGGVPAHQHFSLSCRFFMRGEPTRRKNAACGYPESMWGKHEALPLQKLFVRFIPQFSNANI